MIKKRLAKGFSLIELMIVVAIVGILAGVAYPSYVQYTERVQRVKAQEALEGMAMAMERVRLEQNDYRLFNGAATPTDISTSTRPNANFYPDQSPMSGAARYNLTVEEATRGFFVLRATPINGQLMDGDGYFELHSTGRRGWDQDGGGVGANEWCWSDRKGAC